MKGLYEGSATAHDHTLHAGVGAKLGRRQKHAHCTECYAGCLINVLSPCIGSGEPGTRTLGRPASKMISPIGTRPSVGHGQNVS